MTTLEVTPALSDASIVKFIRDHLAAGQNVQVMASEPYLTPAEVAERLGLSRAFVMNKLKEGTLASVRRGTRHRITLSEVERFRAWYTRDLVEFSAADALDDLFGDNK
jgi:excisionase family DNA binding protein